MNADQKNFKHRELTDQIIQAFYTVYNKLGYGFLEKVYVNALMIELEKSGINAKHQQPLRVLYDNVTVGEYFADIVVDDLIIIEVKAAKGLTLDHEAQLLNYLKSTRCEVGLILNFGPRPEFKRKAFDNARK
jgi:GxxExxY protein